MRSYEKRKARISIRKRLRQLQELAGSDSDLKSYLEELKRLLLSDFDQTYSFVRTHKLLTRSRNLSIVRKITANLYKWIDSAPLKGKRKARLKRHLKVCETVQTIFSYIDNAAQHAALWSADIDTLTLTTLGLLEYIAEVTARDVAEYSARHPETGLDPDRGVQRLRALHDYFRDLCDASCLILRQAAVRKHNQGNTRVTKESVDELFGFARAIDKLQLYFDNYSYHNWQASVTKNTINFRPPHKDSLLMEYWSDQLLHATDQLKLLPKILASRDLHDKFLVEPRVEIALLSFEEFVSSTTGKALLKESRKSSVPLYKHMISEITEVFDEAAVLTTDHGAFTIKTLIESWTLLQSLAACSQYWVAARIRSSDVPGEYARFAPVMSEQFLGELLSKELNITLQHAVQVTNQFKTSVEPGRNLDLFFKPLIELRSKEILPSFTFIESGRFYRNVFAIAIQESDLDLSPRGLKPLHSIASRFKQTNFKSATNIRVYVDDLQLTDVDLLLLKDHVLFLAQAKVVIQPDSPYEFWKVRMKLAQAAKQLERTMGAFHLIKEQLLNALGASEAEKANLNEVRPFILTNVVSYMGFRSGGYPIVNFDYLKMLLRGGRVGLLNVDREGITPLGGVRLIAGMQPTGNELSKLIDNPNPYYESMFSKPHYTVGTIQIGPFTLEVPVFTDEKKEPSDRERKDQSRASMTDRLTKLKPIGEIKY